MSGDSGGGTEATNPDEGEGEGKGGDDSVVGGSVGDGSIGDCSWTHPIDSATIRKAKVKIANNLLAISASSPSFDNA